LARLDSRFVTDFATRVQTFLDATFSLDPVFATAMGKHDHDGRWPDLSPSGRERRMAFVNEWTVTFAGLSEGGLDADERIDREILLGELAAQAFADRVLREESWSPMWWVYLIGEGLFSLLARDFAPLADRLASLAARAEAVPTVLDAARAVLVGATDRPVDRFHTEKALEQWPGLISIVDEAIDSGERAASEGDDAVAAGLGRLRAARATAGAALAEFERHLREDVLAGTSGEGRLGAGPFAEKLVHTMRDPTMTPDRVRTAALREYHAVRAEMIRIAREIAPEWLAVAPPDDDVACVNAVLDAIAVVHPAASELIAFCAAELTRIEAFCRERDLIGLAAEPLRIEWTPVFLRAFGGAMLNSPGPLEPGQRAMFLITPVDDGPPDRIESRLREDNDRMLRLLTIHEAVPGHYLQGVYANRVPSIVRTIFGSGVFAEGWAVYVTQVMVDSGYEAADPALLLTHWKFYLRSVTNALIDVGIHVDGMTEAEAVELMVEGAFQEEAEALAKYDRARLSSTQLSTYFVGSMAFWELEDEVRRRAAADAGAAAASVPTPRVVGGYGETPGFTYRPHLEALLGHGAPPMPILRRLLLP